MDFQKLALVDPQQVMNYGVDPTHTPIKRSLTELDNEMSSVLQSNLSDKDKVDRYNQILQRYLMYYSKSLDPVTVQLKGDNANSKSEYLSSKVPEQVLRLIPATFRPKAAELLDRIKESENMSWTDNGQLVVGSRVIPNTNITDLISDVVRSRKTAKPPSGWQEFVIALKDLNIPEEVIGNKDRFRYMMSGTLESAENNFTTPPSTPRARLARGRGTPIRPPAAEAIKWDKYN